MMVVIVSTAEGKALTARQVADELAIPCTSVRRHLDILVGSERCEAVGGAYIAQWDWYDECASNFCA